MTLLLSGVAVAALLNKDERFTKCERAWDGLVRLDPTMPLHQDKDRWVDRCVYNLIVDEAEDRREGR